MKYSDNDSELINLIYDNSEEAKDKLMNKYKGLIYTIAKKYYPYAKEAGFEEKDLAQEGLIGLNKAIDTYKANKNTLFYSYAVLCIESQMKTAVKSANKKRNELMNSSLSLEGLLDDENVNMEKILSDETSDPSRKIMEDEDTGRVNDLLDSSLSEKEREILKLKLDGYKNKEISIKLGKDVKSIENTVFRIKAKLKKILNE